MRILAICAAALGPGAGLVVLLLAFPSSVRFHDFARQGGVTPVIVSGSLEKKYVLEVNGSGVCWLDYDRDGYSDLYLVNGSSLEEALKKEDDPSTNYRTQSPRGNSRVRSTTG